jgi:hypothetical protein
MHYRGDRSQTPRHQRGLGGSQVLLDPVDRLGVRPVSLAIRAIPKASWPSMSRTWVSWARVKLGLRPLWNVGREVKAGFTRQPSEIHPHRCEGPPSSPWASEGSLIFRMAARPQHQPVCSTFGSL